MIWWLMLRTGVVGTYVYVYAVLVVQFIYARGLRFSRSHSRVTALRDSEANAHVQIVCDSADCAMRSVIHYHTT